ncbi:efflux RND transporter periplasmic adaptor subunit [bacterium]|nr:MAG: efflux RND transporter periplasmic adaptor subunit [bacterium]
MTNRTKLAALVGVTVVAAVALFWPSINQEAKVLIPAPVVSNNGSGVLPVDVSVVSEEFLANEIRTTGTLLASEETALFSESSGKVTDIYFKEGQQVKKGTLLIKLNDKDLVAQLDRIKIEKEFADKTMERQKLLFEKGGISREQYDQAQNRVNILQAQVDETIAKIEKTEVRAPFDGIVGLRQISPGAYLTPSIQTASIQNLDVLNLEFSIPEKYFNVVKAGDTIQFTVSNNELAYSAEIYAVEPQIDINTRTVVMRAHFNNKEAKLLPGLFAYIRYTIESINNAILVPSQSIVPELKGQKVYVIRGGLVDEKPVETGMRTDQHVQVTKGLAAGDSVITTGILQIRKGMPIQVRKIVK